MDEDYIFDIVLRFKRVGQEGYFELGLGYAFDITSTSGRVEPVHFNYNYYYDAAISRLMSERETAKDVPQKLKAIASYEDSIDLFVWTILEAKKQGIPLQDLNKVRELADQISDLSNYIADLSLPTHPFEKIDDFGSVSETLNKLLGGELKIQKSKERCFALLTRGNDNYIAISGAKSDYIGKLWTSVWSLRSDYVTYLKMINQDLFGGAAIECHLTDACERKSDPLDLDSQDLQLGLETNVSGLEGEYSCCERKILAYAGGAMPKDEWFIRYFACKKCIPFLCVGSSIYAYQAKKFMDEVRRFPNLLFFVRKAFDRGVACRMLRLPNKHSGASGGQAKPIGNLV